MANTKQAKKRIIQNEKKHLRNKAIVSRHRTELKKLLALIHANADTNGAEFKKQLHLIIQLTDSAVNKEVYHRNKAARIKSRLFNKVHALSKKKTAETVVVEKPSPAVRELEDKN